MSGIQTKNRKIKKQSLTDRTVRTTVVSCLLLGIIALLIGSCILCTSSAMKDESMVVAIIIRAVGFVGYIVSIVFIYRLCKDMKKGK